MMHPGSAAQIPAFYMDTSHLFSTPHPRLAPPSLAQQQGFQPGLSQVGNYTYVAKANLLKIEFDAVNISPSCSQQQCSRFLSPSMLRCKVSRNTNTHTRPSWDLAPDHLSLSHKICSALLCRIIGIQSSTCSNCSRAHRWIHLQICPHLSTLPPDLRHLCRAASPSPP